MNRVKNQQSEIYFETVAVPG